MAISNISINPIANSAGNSPVGSAAASAVDRNQPSASPQPSTTVTLSVQGQKLSQAPAPSNPTQTSTSQTNQAQTSSTVDTTVTPNAVPQSKETTSAPGIQFMAGERKSGRVNTFA
jgi:hypothetical protein